MPRVWGNNKSNTYNLKNFRCEVRKVWPKWGHGRSVSTLTFCFSSKYSLLKLLSNIRHLCEGTHLQPLRLDFLSHPHSTLWTAIFGSHENITRGKAPAPISVLSYPTSPPSRHHAPIHLPIINRQGKQCAVPHHCAPLEDFPIDLVSTELVSVFFIFFVASPPQPSLPPSHIDKIPPDVSSTPPLTSHLRRCIPIFSSTLGPPTTCRIHGRGEGSTPSSSKKDESYKFYDSDSDSDLDSDFNTNGEGVSEDSKKDVEDREGGVSVAKFGGKGDEKQ